VIEQLKYKRRDHRSVSWYLDETYIRVDGRRMLNA
jgi:transposase-like protein